MRGYVVKPAPDSGDYYVIWSDNVEAPTAWGPRDYLAPLLTRNDGEDVNDRFDRADRTGSSALWPSSNDPYLRFGQGMIYMQRGWLPRENLTALCDRLGADENDPVTDLLRPLDGETEVREP